MLCEEGVREDEQKWRKHCIKYYYNGSDGVKDGES